MNSKILSAVAVAAVLVSGCAAMRAAQAKNDYLKAQTQNLVIAQPLEQVWPSVQRVVFAHGYQLKQTSSLGAFSMETESKYESSNTGSVAKRYLIQGFTAEGGSRVTFTYFAERSSNTGTSTDSGRDWKLEYELLKIVDPQRAEQLDAEGERLGQEAASKS